jgi:hypothetical protein
MHVVIMKMDNGDGDDDDDGGGGGGDGRALYWADRSSLLWRSRTWEWSSHWWEPQGPP